MTVTPEMIMAVRYELSDTELSLPILSDQEYIYFLNKNNLNIRRTALDCAKTILFKLSMSSGRRTVDILSIDNSRTASAYKEALMTYIKNDALSGALGNIVPYAGGISKSDMQKNIANPDTNAVVLPVIFSEVPVISNDFTPVSEQPVVPPAEVGFTFDDPMTSSDSTLWQASNWTNSYPFFNSWAPSQLTYSDSKLNITLIENEVNAVSGECSTLSTYQYGTYKFVAKASNTPGVINGLFTYTGMSLGTRHDEIDFEIKGDDPTKVQVNYWTDDVEHPVTIDLGFDASTAFHEYSFTWLPDKIQWFVDGALIHEETGTNGELPSIPCKVFLNLWGAVGTEPWSTDYVPSAVPSVMQVDNVSFTALVEVI